MSGFSRNLDGDSASELGVERTINLAHAASAKQHLNFEGTEAVPGASAIAADYTGRLKFLTR